MALPQISIGQEVLDRAMLDSVEVVQELNRHWSCLVVCRQTTDQRIVIEELLGKPVQIKTTDEQGVEHIHFTGFVHDVELTYEVWGSYRAQLTAISDSYTLDIATHKQYYPDSTLASLAGTIGGRAGLSIDANVPARKALNYAQYGETDFAFLNRVVDDYGAWLRAKPGGLEIFSAFQSGTTVQWRGHDGLIEFALGGRLTPPNVSGAHYDHHAMASQTFTGVSKPPAYFDGGQWLTGPLQSGSQQLPPGFEPQRARAMTLDDYQQQLEAESERHLGGAATGRGSSRSQQLMAGNTVQIDGDIQARGTYGLIKVVHRWTPAGYANDFVCTPWKNYRNPRPPAARIWQGAVPARVTAHDDPKKMGRVQVQYFWQEDGVTHWARMVSPHAGGERGMMFMPEVGDEVSVMFEDGDPERPIVVGSLWNGVHQAPRLGFFSPEADIPENNVKRIVTQSGNRMQMVDTPGRETMLLATPHNASLRMTEKDNATARPLVVLQSAGDIILSAPQGRVHIQSKFFSREVGTGGTPAAPAAAKKSKSADSNTPPHVRIPPECNFLRKQFRAEGTPANFNANRRKVTLGSPKKIHYQFPGADKPVEATERDATSGTQTVQIIRPIGGSSEKDTVLPSTHQIAQSLGAVPPTQFGHISKVVLSPNRNPADNYWSKQYKMPDFRSEATGGSDGTIRWYPISKDSSMIPDETMVHESGHTFSSNIWRTPADWKPWQDAVKSDARAPSDYAESSKEEDFSESLVMYTMSKGTQCEATARALYPARYKILDQVLHSK